MQPDAAPPHGLREDDTIADSALGAALTILLRLAPASAGVDASARAVAEYVLNEGAGLHAALSAQAIPRSVALVAAAYAAAIVNWADWGFYFVVIAGSDCALHSPAEPEEELLWLTQTTIEMVAEAAGSDAISLLRQDDALAIFKDMAARTEVLEWWECSVACALHVAEFDPQGDETAETFSLRALLLARRLDDARLMGRSAVVAAGILCRRADIREEKRAEAFDSMHAAIESLAMSCLQNEAPWLRVVSAIVSHVWLRPLLELLNARLPQVLRSAFGLPDEHEAIAGLICDDAWSDQTRDAALSFASCVMALNNARATFAAAGDPSVATVRWSRLDIVHPSFRDCIPLAGSILRSADRAVDHLLLSLAHEATHVISIVGPIGLTMAALRVAAQHEEAALWALRGEAHPSDNWDRLGRSGPAPLHRESLKALARCEQALAQYRKLRILRDVWTAWLEGVALFSEHTDPSEDRTWISLHSDVVRQFVDLYMDCAPTEIEAVVGQHARAMELRYQSAIQTSAGPRMRDMFSHEDGPYVMGYLLVRSVVSRWRMTLGREVAGAELQRLLLHATRYGTEEAIPDLDLPIEPFETAAIAGFAAWVESLTCISRTALETFLRDDSSDAPRQTFGWEGGQPKSYPNTAERRAAGGAELERRHRQRIAQALRPVAAFGPAVAEDEQDTIPWQTVRRAIGRVAAALLPGEDQDYLATLSALSRLMVFSALIIPVAETEAGFSLNLSDNRLLIIIPTRRADGQASRFVHNILWMPLGPESSRELAGEIRRLGQPRLTVNRIVDLLPDAADGRPPGAHFIVLRYGNWCHVSAAGMLANSAESREERASEIRRRLQPSALEAMEQRMEDGAESARRILDWLEQIPEPGAAMAAEALHPWREHVTGLARAVLGGSVPSTVRNAARAALVAAYGEVPGVDVIVGHDGFRKLVPRAARGACVDFLLRSASGPLPDSDAGPLVTGTGGGIMDFIGPSSFGWDVRAAKLNVEGRT